MNFLVKWCRAGRGWGAQRVSGGASMIPRFIFFFFFGGGGGGNGGCRFTEPVSLMHFTSAWVGK